MTRFVLILAASVIGAVGFVALREATISRHESRPPGSTTELVMRASSRGAERTQSLDELVIATVLACRLEVNADLAGAVRRVGDGRYRSVLRPALDRTDRRQLRGCLEDWGVDHLRLEVLQVRDRW